MLEEGHEAGPLPRIRFVLMVSDGHGSTTPAFNGSCTCTREQTCCDPTAESDVRAASGGGGGGSGVTRQHEQLPPAPVFATVHCRFSYDISVPSIIDDLLDTRSEASIEASVRKWVAIGDGVAWEAREPKAYLVSDDKAHRPKAHRQGLSHPKYLAVHRAVMCTRCASNATRAARRPFSEHARYRATIYAHGFHFNSVRMRRLSLLGGAVIAEESPCKEWWQLLAHPWVHYAPTAETFFDLPRTAERLLSPSHDAQARRMALRLKALGLRAFRAHGLLDYIEALWREYARLAHVGQGHWGGDGPHPAVTVPNAVPNAVPRAVPHAVPRAAPSMASLKASSAWRPPSTTHGVRPVSHQAAPQKVDLPLPRNPARRANPPSHMRANPSGSEPGRRNGPILRAQGHLQDL